MTGGSCTALGRRTHAALTKIGGQPEPGALRAPLKP